MKRSVRYLPLTLALLAGSYAHAKELPNYDAYLNAKAAPPAAASLNASAAAPGGFVASTDDLRGVPTFFWVGRSQRRPPLMANVGQEQLAMHYLRQNASTYRLSPKALETAVVRRVHDTGRGGVVVVFRQRVNGIELINNDAKILMDRNGDLIAIGGNLHAAAVATWKGSGRTFRLGAEKAIASAFDDLHGVKIPAESVRDAKKEKAGYRSFNLLETPAVKAAKLEFSRPARAKKVFFPMPDRIVPAYYVELATQARGSTDTMGYAYVIAADDGRLLSRRNLKQSDVFNYRVWADNTGLKTPLDGPQTDFTPHPTGIPDGSKPDFILPELISMAGFNTNPNNAADPWLPPNATQTKGNNVDAYTDHDDPDGFSPGDLRATTTSAQTFDRVYDTAADPLASEDQSMAAVTQLFYVNNWMHDWWYDSGFNEQAGNAQADNYGRGGIEGDPIHAEAQDAVLLGQSDNANMNTPDDGESPIMQMYVYYAPADAGVTAQPLNVSMGVGVARFGPENFDIAGDLMLVDDASGASATDGCEAIGNVAGQIALLDRGDCSFKQKAVNAEAAGAVGVILVNDVDGSPPNMPGTTPPGSVQIPILSITKADGDTLKTALKSGPLTVSMKRKTEGPRRDGTIDNMIIAHEWGHYLHMRLVDGCSTTQCGGQSEGWGDFNALHMAIREGDTFQNKAYSDGPYASAAFGDAGYFGSRRVPYSTDFTKNGLTFKHISDGEALPNNPMQSTAPFNPEVHNVGEVWATMLFEAYTGLITDGGHTFIEAKRRMSDYIVAGMSLAPVAPTFTEQRDGILAAAYAADKNDFLILAQGFARRGAGSCADSPPRASGTLVGVTESFKVAPRHSIVSITIDDSIKSCDNDGVLDAEETGNVTVTVTNTGASTLKDTTGTVTSSVVGVTFPSGATLSFGDLAPFTSVTATVAVAVDKSIVKLQNPVIDVSVTNPESCIAKVTQHIDPRVNADTAVAASTIETVEADTKVWELKGDPAEAIWSRVKANGDTRWVGVDYGDLTDTRLESPDLVVGQNGGFTITFDHKYEFETGPDNNGGPDVYWDGSVVEITENDGLNWTDIGAYANPDYNGTIGDLAGNPLANRKAYINKNPSWPSTDKVTLDLGDAFNGKTVKIRFHIGTDQAAGAPGWEIDNISFLGITNKPFDQVVDDASTCETLPNANAGTDQSVKSGDKVTLDASKSSDPEGDALSFAWKQTSGPSVDLAGGATAAASFTAPNVSEATILSFELAVSDGKTSDTDTIDILVAPVTDTGSGGSGSSSAAGGATTSGPADEGGCGCRAVGEGSTAPTGALSAASILAMMGLLLRRRSKGARSSS